MAETESGNRMQQGPFVDGILLHCTMIISALLPACIAVQPPLKAVALSALLSRVELSLLFLPKQSRYYSQTLLQSFYSSSMAQVQALVAQVPGYLKDFRVRRGRHRLREVRRTDEFCEGLPANKTLGPASCQRVLRCPPHLETPGPQCSYAPNLAQYPLLWRKL